MDELEQTLNRIKGYQSKPSVYECDICKDVGWLTKMDGGYEFTYPCECTIKKQMIDSLERSGITEDVLHKQTFETFKVDADYQKLMKNKAMGFCNQKENTFFFVGGQVGCGKTHICTAICKLHYDLAQPFYYVMYGDVVNKLKALAMDEENYSNYLNSLNKVKVLFIDDLFKGKGKSNDGITDADVKHLFKIINNRYLSNKVTIISSERTLQEVLLIDQGIGSRIKEKCGEFAVSIGDDIKRNYRLK